MATQLLQSLPADLPPPTMADMLLADHRDTLVLCRHFRKAAQANDAQLMEKLADAIAVTIRLHSQGEMDTLYPYMEKTLGKKESHVDQCLKEHTEVEEDVIEALEKRKEGGDELTEVVDRIFDEFETHMRHEEDAWVVSLLEKASEKELASVVTEFMKAKERAPLEPPQA